MESWIDYAYAQGGRKCGGWGENRSRADQITSSTHGSKYKTSTGVRKSRSQICRALHDHHIGRIGIEADGRLSRETQSVRPSIQQTGLMTKEEDEI